MKVVSRFTGEFINGDADLNITLIPNSSIDEELYKILDENDTDDYSVKYFSSVEGKNDKCIIRVHKEETSLIYLQEHEI